MDQQRFELSKRNIATMRAGPYGLMLQNMGGDPKSEASFRLILSSLLKAARASNCKVKSSALGADHHTRQAFARTIGWPFLQPNAFWNSSKLLTDPFTRNSDGEWGLVST